MSRRLTPGSTLENLKREAKRWLKALRAGDAAARARFERAHPEAPAEPVLRHVQHALAREHGMPGWPALKREVLALEAGDGAVDARSAAATRLFTAALAGDVAAVNAVLDGHPGLVNERALLAGHDGLRTALHHAVEHAAVVAALLERGADPNIRDEGDNAMPLHFAAEREDLDAIRLLLAHGADPVGAGDHHDLEVIGWATVFGTGRADVVEMLLAHGARHNILSAVATGAVDEIRAIVAAAPGELERVMDRTNLRRRPLHLAVVKRQSESLRALLELGADAQARDAAGLTPLDQAALNGEAEMVEQLLEHGAPVTLPAAVALERTADVERLLREQPDALKPGGAHTTLLARASERGSAAVIRALIRAGADVNAPDDATTSIDAVERYTPLHAAAFHGNAEAVAVLLEHRANPNVRDGKYCSPPAGWAAYAGHPDVRDRILRARIDVFQAIDFGLVDRIAEIVRQGPWQRERRFGELASCTSDSDPQPWHTPLAWAAATNRVDAVRVLLEEGAAQPLSPDRRTLIEIAEDAGYDEVAALLRRHRRIEETHDGRVRWFVKNACPDHDVRGPAEHVTARHAARRLLQRHPEIATDSFYTAVVCGRLDAVRRALAERPELAAAKGGPKGWEPLLYLCFARLPDVAAAVDHAVEIARLLLDHGADPNAFFMAGDSRYTPLVGAVGEGEEGRPPHPRRNDLVDLLLERGAEPYDIQVLYNIHFRGDALWFMERIHNASVTRGRAADWADPAWRMLNMGGYGHGARYVLEMAIANDNRALATWALEHGASPDAAAPPHPNLPKWTLHEEALRRGRVELAELFVRHGAAPSRIEPEHEGAFVAASLRLDRAAIDAMIARHPEHLRSTTAIFAAAEADRADAVALLLEIGVPIDIENERKQRPLHAAAWADAVNVAKLLIDRGAEIDPIEAEWGNTPIDFAVYGQHARMIALLTPFTRDVGNLVFTGAVERLRDVLREEPERARIRGAEWTPLMWLPEDEAAAAAIVALLLEHGADATVRDRDGRTAADHAARRGLEAAAALLRAAEDGRT